MSCSTLFPLLDQCLTKYLLWVEKNKETGQWKDSHRYRCSRLFPALLKKHLWWLQLCQWQDRQDWGVGEGQS